MQHLNIELAHRFVRGKLPADETEHWTAHLGVCQRCDRLVADERSWSNLLKLQPRDLNAETASAERVLPRLESLIPGQARGRKRRQTLLLLGSGLCLAVAAVAIVQRAASPSPARQLAAELHITEERQARIVANLDTLLVLKKDPWLVDELGTVEMFDKLLLAEQGAAP